MSLRDTLKLATRAAHESLERRIGLDGPQLEPERYVNYLARTHAFYAGMAPRLRIAREMWSIVPDFEAMLSWLENDLAFFGRKRSCPAVPQDILPRLHGLPEIAGCSYVLHGAALGGAVLYAQLHGRWGLERGRGASFLFGYGPSTGTRWKAFVEELNDFGARGGCAERCVLAARQTFCAIAAVYGEAVIGGEGYSA